MAQASAFPSMDQLTPEDYAQLLAELTAFRLTTQAQAQPAMQAAPHHVVKPPKPELFKGGRKVASWLFALEQYFAVVHLQQDADRVNYAAALLRDAAADWWRGLNLAAARNNPQNPQPAASWTEFKQLMQRHFQPIHEEDFARQQIRTIKQSGSIRDYVVKFQSLILQIPTMDERSRVDAFIAGLQVDARRWVKLQDPRTLEDALSIAERFQTMLMQDRAAVRTYKHLSRGAEDATTTPMELGYIGKPKAKPAATSRKPDGKGNTVPAYWECGEPGHLRRDCPKRRKNHQKGSRINHAAAEDSDDSSNA